MRWFINRAVVYKPCAVCYKPDTRSMCVSRLRTSVVASFGGGRSAGAHVGGRVCGRSDNKGSIMHPASGVVWRAVQAKERTT
jgi:hypothetical protein